MRKPIIVAAVAGTLAVGGTAVAASGGAGEVFGGNPERDFAQDLAAELGGDVTAGEVENALEAVAENHMTERRTAMAEAIVEHLDGVTVDAVEDALAVVDERMREGFEDGEPPEPGMFTQVLAEELGVSEDDVESALEAVREEQLEDAPMLHERFESKGHDEVGPIGPIGPGGPPHVEFAFPAPRS